MRATYWQHILEIVGPATRDKFGQIGQQDTREALEAWILAHSSESTRFLDAGCNTGVEGCRLFEKRFPGSYVGADSNLKALAYALNNLRGRPASFTWADLESVPYPSQSFDIVLTKDVIEHAPGYGPILRELARLSKRWLILSMFIKMHDDADFIKEGPPGLFHNRYRRSTLCEVVRAVGFGAPETIFERGDDEVLIFERDSVHACYLSA